MPSTTQQLRRINGAAGSPATAGPAGQLACNFPGAAGTSSKPELWASDGTSWRQVNPDVAVEEEEDLGAALSGAATIDRADGNYFYGTMAADTTFALTNAGLAATSLSLLLTTGGYSPTFTGVTWMNDETPMAASGTYLIGLFYINAKWYGVLVQ